MGYFDPSMIISVAQLYIQLMTTNYYGTHTIIYHKGSTSEYGMCMHKIGVHSAI